MLCAFITCTEWLAVCSTDQALRLHALSCGFSEQLLIDEYFAVRTHNSSQLLQPCTTTSASLPILTPIWLR